MHHRNLTQTAFAHMRGVSRPLISQKLSGMVRWTEEDYYFMSRLFGCSVDYLMGLSDEPKINEAVPFQVRA